MGTFDTTILSFVFITSSLFLSLGEPVYDSFFCLIQSCVFLCVVSFSGPPCSLCPFRQFILKIFLVPWGYFCGAPCTTQKINFILKVRSRIPSWRKTIVPLVSIKPFATVKAFKLWCRSTFGSRSHVPRIIVLSFPIRHRGLRIHP